MKNLFCNTNTTIPEVDNDSIPCEEFINSDCIVLENIQQNIKTYYSLGDEPTLTEYGDNIGNSLIDARQRIVVLEGLEDSYISNIELTDTDLVITGQGNSFDGTIDLSSIGAFPGFTDLPTDYGVTLSTVATSNDYNDLDNLPTLVSQLSDLSDVNTSTPTNRNVLVADGVDWESRALVLADISDYVAPTTLTKYSETFGNGVDTSIQITHNLGTEDLTGILIREVSSGEIVQTTTVIDDNNNITLTFTTAPTTNQYRVIITA